MERKVIQQAEAFTKQITAALDQASDADLDQLDEIAQAIRQQVSRASAILGIEPSDALSLGGLAGALAEFRRAPRLSSLARAATDVGKYLRPKE